MPPYPADGPGTDVYKRQMIDLAEKVNGEITSEILKDPDVLRVRVI